MDIGIYRQPTEQKQRKEEEKYAFYPTDKSPESSFHRYKHRTDRNTSDIK